MSWIYQQGDVFDPETMLTWVFDETDLERLLDAIEEAGEVVIDLETTGLDEHALTNGPVNGGVAARIAMAAVTVAGKEVSSATEPMTYIVPLSHPEGPWAGRWRDVMRRIAVQVRDHHIPLTNQNVKFDVRWITATTDVSLVPNIEWDTQVGSFLMDEQSSTKLKERAPKVFGIERWDEDMDFRVPGAAERADLFELGKYAGRDTYWTRRLAEFQRSALNLHPLTSAPPMDEDEREHNRLGQLARYLAMPTTASLTSIEERGIALDQDYVDDLRRQAGDRAHELFEELARKYPEMDPEQASFAPTSLWFMEWAQRAVDVGDLEVISLTPKGRPQWNASVLRKLSRKGLDTAAKLLELRDMIKRQEFLRSWTHYATGSGRIHSTYHSASVVTGRLSSSAPNMQQVSKKLRPSFTASPGYVIADIDYSQIELRVAAHVSECIPMIEAYQRGDDLHRLFARRIMQIGENKRAEVSGEFPRTISLEEVTAEERQKAKAANFGLLYGMGPMGFQLYAEDSYGVIMSMEEASRIHEAFFQMWTGLRQWHSRAVAELHRHGQVTSPTGRIRRLPDVYSGVDGLVQAAERAAINTVVQGLASDLMQASAASIGGQLPGHTAVEGARIVGTVHDSIVVEVPEDRWEEVTRECIDRMTNIDQYFKQCFGFSLDVPLAAEAVVGRRWSDDSLGNIE